MLVKNKKDEYLQETDTMKKRVGEDTRKRFLFTGKKTFATRDKENKGKDQEKEPKIKSAKQLEVAVHSREYGGSIATIVESYQQKLNLLNQELEEREQRREQIQVRIEDLQAQIEGKKTNIELAKQLEAAAHSREFGGSIRIAVESYPQEQNPFQQAELREMEERREQIQVRITDLQAQIEEIKEKLMSSAIVVDEIYNKFIYIYNSEARNWKKCNVCLPFRGQILGAAILKEELYVIGTIDRNLKNGNVETSYCKLDEENEWHVLAEMNGEIECIKSTIVFNEEIWVIGGWNETQKSLKSVKKYNPETNSWTSMAEMNHARVRCAAVVINKKIYVSGGWNIEKESCLKSVEVYDPDENKWEIFCDLPFRLYDHSALVDGTNLIIIGGRKSVLNNGFDRISKEVLKMDISNPTNNWEHLPDLIHEYRYSHGALKTEEGLMVFNGDFAEIFDGNEWKIRPGLSSLFEFVTIQISKKDEELFLRKLCS